VTIVVVAFYQIKESLVHSEQGYDINPATAYVGLGDSFLALLTKKNWQHP
jgi:hypothetical protein